MSAQTAPPAPPRPRLLTAAEFKALPRTAARQELHEGVLVEMPPPTKRHTRLANRVRDRLAGARPGWEALTGLGCELVPGSRDVGTGLRDTVVEPDVAVLPAAALDAVPEEDYLPGAPPLVVEVVSTTDRLARVTWKAGRYLLAGAVLVWVLDPKRRRAVVFRRDALPEPLPEDGALDGEGVLPGLRLPLAELWAPGPAEPDEAGGGPAD
jgi:Uma2 family endonuclease